MPQTPEERQASGRIRSARYRTAHPEKIIAYSASWYAAHREEKLAYSVAYRLEHPGQVSTYNAAWHAAHVEEEAAYREVHREEIMTRLAAYRAANKDMLAAKSALYYQTHRAEHLAACLAWRTAHPEKDRAINATYRAAHPEKVAARIATWRAANREEMAAYDKVYRATHPEHGRAKADRRRARLTGAEINDLSGAQRREIKLAYGCLCAYCHDTFPLNKLTIDHITPIVAYGNNTLHNVVIACGPCNSKKGTGPPLCPVQPMLLTIASPKPAKRKG